MELMQTLDDAWNAVAGQAADPRRVFFASGDWTCSIARWDDNGQIVEENLFYDLVTFMKQIGLGG